MKGQPWLFKWRQFETEVIVCAVRWYLGISATASRTAKSRNSSLSAASTLTTPRSGDGSNATHPSWRFATELTKPTNKSWHLDETYVRVKGEWCYLYRAVDSEGATVEFFLSAFRDKESAQSLFRRAIRHGAPPPRVINTDLAPTYPAAIAGLQRSGNLPRRCRHRPVQCLTNIVEQDHRFVKKRIVAKQGFRAFGSARCTVDGYEAIHQMRKGQVRWLPARAIVRHNLYIDRLFGLVR